MPLPKYPIPELNHTVEEVRRVLKLILDEDEFLRFSSVLEERKEALKKYDEEFKKELKGKDNWATEMFKHHLLSLRVPIPISTSLPVLMEPSIQHSDQIAHSAALLWSAGHLKQKMSQFISQLQGVVLEKMQQSEIFSTTRIPARDTDKIEVYDNSKHAVLLYKGSAFRVDIFDLSGEPISVQEIYNQIASIVAYNGEFYQEICNYTAYERNLWSEIRSSLKKGGAGNSLDIMERAIVTIALEDCEKPLEFQDATDYVRLGGKGISCMRYYDKILNIIVFKNGKYGLLFEHSAVDGLIISMITELIYNICEKTEVDVSAFSKRPVNILDFKIQNISRNQLQYNHLMTTFDFYSYPDIFATLRNERIFHAWINFSLQFALLKTFGHLKYLMVTPTHVRHFKNGRSDPTYSITETSVKFLHTVLNSDSEDTLVQFIAALDEYRRMVKFTKYGKGIGPHIAQLRKRIPENGVKSYFERFAIPEIYLTGSEFLEGAECGVGNVYAADQIAIGYCGKKDRVKIVMSATGLFKENLKALRENFENSLLLILKIASRVAIASQMGALHLFKTVNPFTRKIQNEFSIAIHGGAGETILQDESVIEMVSFTLRTAISLGIEVLNNGGSSVDAVESAVVALENCFLFNAGRGAVYNYEGIHELEASIMDGKSQNSGSVACLTDIKNPVRAARMVMEKYPHALISGTPNKSDLVKNNISFVKNDYFNTDIRYKQLMMVKSGLQGLNLNHPQTVGAVAIDSDGNLAAASSTGGMVNKLKGRIGDTAVIGAGLYADENIAVACSGDGEAFLRKSIASKIATLCKYSHFSLQDACHNIFKKELRNSYGGVIGVDSKGNVIIESNAKIMFTASCNGENIQVDFSTKSDTKNEWIIYENKNIIAYLHSSPCTTGVTLIERKNESISDIFSLSKQDFVNLMIDVQHVSDILCKRLGIQRCSLIAESRDKCSAKILLIPLHGLTDDWKPCICLEPEFNSCYPGYCSSKNGPRASDSDLNRMQSKIREKLESQEISYKFDGNVENPNLFARIVKGEEKAQWRVWEDENHVAFLTPFPNSPGFTVLVPRKHLDSNVFALEKNDYERLMLATHEVSHLLKLALGAKTCALIFEGFEIDYAHVKLIPLLEGENVMDNSKITHFQHSYEGFISSLDGPKANDDDLNAIYPKLISIDAPASWKTPAQHSIIALTHPWYSEIFQIQNTLYHCTVEFFHQKNKYFYVMTPLTTDTISSPMGLGSDSEPVQVNLMGQNVYLADSMQFCLEYFLRLQDGLPGTYYLSPSFRGENPDNTHLNQFYHVECELLGCMDSAIRIAEQYLYYLTKQMLEKHQEIILKLAGTTIHIKEMLKMYEDLKCFPRITMDEALKLMPSFDCFEPIEESNPKFGMKLTRKGEKFLITKYNGPVWLTEMDHLGVPFYQAYVEGTNLVKAKAADLLIGMGETLGLGERHKTAEEVQDALAHHQIPEDTYNWYINMRRFKPLNTSGWGMGTERYLCWLLNHNDVRDTHIIPRLKNQKFLP